MNLCSRYNFDVKNILAELNKNPEKILKLQGYRCRKDQQEIHLLGWQYTRADFGFFHFLTYIFLEVTTDLDYKITSLQLHEDFRGSQGAKCQGCILNDLIQDIFKGEELSLRNPKIKDSKLPHCRHIYEILYGMCNFLDYGVDKNDYYHFEKTVVRAGLSAIELDTKLNLDGTKFSHHATLSNLNKLKLDHDYNICSANKFKFETKMGRTNLASAEIVSNTKDDFTQQFLKIIFRNWMSANAQMGLDNVLSFSVLWPTNYYSYLIELLTVRKKFLDTNAINKCAANFQIVDGEPLCLGFEDR